MIRVTFNFYEQMWQLHDYDNDFIDYFPEKQDAIDCALAAHPKQMMDFKDLRFARHPTQPEFFISEAGAMTFYKVWREKNPGKLLLFIDWVAIHLDTDFD